MYSPTISIITPIFNGEQYIAEIRQSILAQTFREFEWIVIDDCSTDGTRGRLREMANADSRVKPLFMEKNEGPIVARNRGMDSASGRYIAFVDADDLWVPEKLEKQLAFMKEKDLALSYTSFRKIDNKGKLISKVTIPVPKKVTYRKLIGSNSIPASSAMFDRTKTGDIRQDTTAPVSKDDLFFWLKILEKCEYAMGLQEDLLRLRIHGDSITGNKLVMARRHWKMYREIFGFSIMKSLRYYIVYSVKGLAKYMM